MQVNPSMIGSENPQVGTVSVGPGDQAGRIRKAQEELRRLGYPVEPTGEADDSTRQATADYQKANKLPATGDLDDSTMELLIGKQREDEVGENG